MMDDAGVFDGTIESLAEEEMVESRDVGDAFSFVDTRKVNWERTPCPGKINLFDE